MGDVRPELAVEEFTVFLARLQRTLDVVEAALRESERVRAWRQDEVAGKVA